MWRKVFEENLETKVSGCFCSFCLIFFFFLLLCVTKFGCLGISTRVSKCICICSCSCVCTTPFLVACLYMQHTIWYGIVYHAMLNCGNCRLFSLIRFQLSFFCGWCVCVSIWWESAPASFLLASGGHQKGDSSDHKLRSIQTYFISPPYCQRIWRALIPTQRPPHLCIQNKSSARCTILEQDEDITSEFFKFCIPNASGGLRLAVDTSYSYSWSSPQK